MPRPQVQQLLIALSHCLLASQVDTKTFATDGVFDSTWQFAAAAAAAAAAHDPGGLEDAQPPR